jgi:hypothetical protein
MEPAEPLHQLTTDSPPPSTVNPVDPSAATAVKPGDLPASKDEHAMLDRIGKYRIVERLGSGGQGEIFRAVHPELGRDVVIKWGAAGLPDYVQQRLIEEGRILARLEDPGLVRVFDVDRHQGRPYIVFEYVAGQSLTDVVRRQPMSTHAAARLVAEVARVLDYAHRQGVLHRDLKVSNILVDAAGRPRLLDFGLALLTQPFTGGSAVEYGVTGTLSCMAPEQARGEGDRVGPRTDVFGLGGVLYALLTGRPPYVSSSPRALLELARQGQVAPPRLQNPRTSRALDRLCQRALATEPDHRFASADAFRRELLRYLARPRWVFAFLLGSVAVLGAGILAWCFSRTAPPGSAATTGPELLPPVVTMPQTVPPTEKPREPPAGWQVFQSKTGGYTVWLPGTPKETRTEAGSGKGKREMIQVMVNDVLSGLTFLASHADFKDRIFPDAEQALDAARDGAKDAIGAKLVSEQRIRLGDHHGRELRLTVAAAKGVLFRLRIYLVGQRNYQLMVGGPETAVEGPAAEEFFRSFSLLRDH